MASYVLTNTGEVIYLDRDEPLAPGDTANVQLAPTDPLISKYVSTYAPGENFWLATDIANDIREQAKPYATGASALAGLPLVTVIDDGGVSGWGGLAAFIESYYGTQELGQVRESSLALENERSGIRFGTMPRVVLRQIDSGGSW